MVQEFLMWLSSRKWAQRFARRHFVKADIERVQRMLDNQHWNEKTGKWKNGAHNGRRTRAEKMGIKTIIR